jgi:secernin
VASSSSTAGWVSDLGTDRHWVTATSAQCLALFKPVGVGEPVDLGPVPDDHDDGVSVWWRHERMARTVMRDPERLATLFLDERDAVERAWVVHPPSGAEAFASGSELLDRWAGRVSGAGPIPDRRPWWVRRYWATRDTMAGIERITREVPAG